MVKKEDGILYKELMLDYVDLLERKEKYGLTKTEEDNLLKIKEILAPYLKEKGHLTKEKKEGIKLLIQKGLSDSEISQMLWVSINTVKVMRKHL